MPSERVRVVYSGRVQGVGFRFTCERLAQGFPVNGFVRNLAGGDVELVAEGEPAAVEAFLAAVRSAMHGKIWNEESAPEPVGEPPFEAFSIRY